ncbi:MAG: ParA family protein, partial [Proteobacteria bacterium]|nr:ParA family protein [Pseudomonadota bacterium]
LAAKFRVLFIDMDPQGSATGILVKHSSNALFDALMGQLPPIQAVTDTLAQYPASLRIMTSSARLSELDDMLAGKLDRFHCVQDILATTLEFDFFIIDCPGSSSLLTLASMVAADFVLIPTSCEPMSFVQLDDMLDLVSAVQKRLNPKLKLLPLAITLFDGRNRLDQEILAELRSKYSELLPTVVHRRVRIKEEFAARLPCTNQDLKNLSKDIYERIRNEPKKIVPSETKRPAAILIEQATIRDDKAVWCPLLLKCRFLTCLRLIISHPMPLFKLTVATIR